MPFLRSGFQQRPSYTPEPARVIVTDPRTPFTQQQETQRGAMVTNMADQYNKATADPFYALPNPAVQKHMESQLVNDVYNMYGASGGSGWEGAKDRAAQAIVNYRLSLVDKQTAALQSLRDSMTRLVASPSQPLQTTGFAPTPPYPGQYSPAQTLAYGTAGQAAGRAATIGTNALFGVSNEPTAPILVPGPVYGNTPGGGMAVEPSNPFANTPMRGT